MTTTTVSNVREEVIGTLRGLGWKKVEVEEYVRLAQLQAPYAEVDALLHEVFRLARDRRATDSLTSYEQERDEALQRVRESWKHEERVAPDEPPATPGTLSPERRPTGDGDSVVPPGMVVNALPEWFAVLHSALCVTGIMAFLLVGLVAGIILAPLAIYPLTVGPLRPWFLAVDWTWHHGEISVPVGLTVALVVWRRRQQVRTLLVATGFASMGVVGVFVLTAIVWGMHR